MNISQLTLVSLLSFTLVNTFSAQSSPTTYKANAEECSDLTDLKQHIRTFEQNRSATHLADIDDFIEKCGIAERYYTSTNQPERLRNVQRIIKAYDEFITKLAYKIPAIKEALHYKNLSLSLNNKSSSQDIQISLTEAEINEIKALENELSNIKFSLAAKKDENSTNKAINPSEEVVATWDKSAFTVHFYTGFEYTDLDTLFSDSTVRLGLQTYFRPGDGIDDLRASANQQGIVQGPNWLKEFPHFYVNISTTSAAESAASAENQDNPSADSNDGGNNGGDVDKNGDQGGDMPDPLAVPENTLRETDLQALDFEIGTFWPIYINAKGSMKENTYQEFAIGPIVTWGGRKIDSIDSFQRRYYGGVRLAFNEEAYFDALYGKSEPLKGKRLQLRFQFPVASTSPGSRVFLGGNVNLELSKKAKNNEGELISEADSFNVYVIWQTNFESIF